MTDNDKQEIKILKSQGYGYKKIADTLDLSINTVKSYCRRHLQNKNASAYKRGFCKNCGIPVKQSPNRKEKKFCSDKCRVDWWMKHVTEHKTKTQQEVKCLLCGKTFITYPSNNRKYCSRDCFYAARRKGCK